MEKLAMVIMLALACAGGCDCGDGDGGDLWAACGEDGDGICILIESNSETCDSIGMIPGGSSAECALEEQCCAMDPFR